MEDRWVIEVIHQHGGGALDSDFFEVAGIRQQEEDMRYGHDPLENCTDYVQVVALKFTILYYGWVIAQCFNNIKLLKITFFK